jgi:hypothetical protein
MIVVYLFDGEKVLELRSLVLLRPLFPPPLPPPPPRESVFVEILSSTARSCGCAHGSWVSGGTKSKRHLQPARASATAAKAGAANSILMWTLTTVVGLLPPATWFSSGQLLHRHVQTTPGQRSRRIRKLNEKLSLNTDKSIKNFVLYWNAYLYWCCTSTSFNKLSL